MVFDFSGIAKFLRLVKHALMPQPPPPPPDGPRVVVGTTGQGTEVEWPLPTLEHAGHALVLGASGSGKTVLVAASLIEEIIARVDGGATAYVIVDPKGDLTAALLDGLAFAAPERLRDIVYLNPFEGGFAFGLTKLASGKTPLDIRSYQLAALVANVSTAAGQQRHLGAGARQLDVLQGVLLGALDCDDPRANVGWSLDALVEPKGLTRLAKITRSARAKQFLSATLSEELRASCASRLRMAFSATEHLERVVTAPTSVQFADILGPGRIVLLDLGAPPGGLVELQALFANLILRLVVEHLLERPSPWTGHHVRLVVDEAQIVAPVLADVAERVLTTGRSRGLSLVTMSQGTTLLAQASETLLDVLCTNVAAQAVGRLAVQDAEQFSRGQSPAKGVEESAGAVRARLVGRLCNLKDREFFYLAPGVRRQFTSRAVDLLAWKAAAAARTGEIEEVKRRYALPPDTPKRTTLSEAVPKAERAAGAPRGRTRWG